MRLARRVKLFLRGLAILNLCQGVQQVTMNQSSEWSKYQMREQLSGHSQKMAGAGADYGLASQPTGMGRNRISQAWPDKNGVTEEPDEKGEQIWIGKHYQETGILVLGESWQGGFADVFATDSKYIAEYLAGFLFSRMCSKLANTCGMMRKEFWHQIAFTNFVQSARMPPSGRPSAQHFIGAKHRLEALLREIQPRGVWILGEEQGRYSAPIVKSAGIVHEITWHPMEPGATSVMLGASWNRLQIKLALQSKGQTLG